MNFCGLNNHLQCLPIGTIRKESFPIPTLNAGIIASGPFRFLQETLKNARFTLSLSEHQEKSAFQCVIAADVSSTEARTSYLVLDLHSTTARD